MRGRDLCHGFRGWSRPPFFFLVAWWRVYVWVVCSGRGGGSRPLLLVYLPVMSVLRFRERASVAVAGFGRGVGGRVVEPVVALVAFGVCVVPGFVLKLCACVDVCQEGFDGVRVLPLSCPVVSCQSLAAMRVLAPSVVIAVVRVSRLPAFSSKLRFCSSGSEFYAPVGAGFWCEYARVALRVAQLAARLFMWVARVLDGASHVSP